MNDIEHRVFRLELTVEGHTEELKELQTDGKAMRESLEAIVRTLQQIKWLTIGGGVVFLATQLGLTEVLKIIL
jgi:hypothetical protein